MKLLKTFLAVGTICALGVMSAQAARMWEDPTSWWDDHWRIDNSSAPKYSAQELSLDAFASFTGAQDGIENVFETNIRNGDVGGGLGLNYFFTRELGLMSDINIGSNEGRFIDHAILNLALRFPMEDLGLAPYIFGGGGRAFDPEWDWIADAGVGVEWRFNPTTGLFTDVRYVWAEDSFDRLHFRGGLRLVF